MINLLPPEEKQKLLLKKNEKLATIFGIVFLVSLICFGLVLLSIKFYILIQANSQKEALNLAEQQYKTPDFNNLTSTVKKYDEALDRLNLFYENEAYFSATLNTIIGVSRPTGLYFVNFSLNRDTGGNIQVNVSGTSDTRDNLIIFKQNIEKNREIKNLYFSPESWVNPKNVNFSLKFEIDKNEAQ